MEWIILVHEEVVLKVFCNYQDDFSALYSITGILTESAKYAEKYL